MIKKIGKWEDMNKNTVYEYVCEYNNIMQDEMLFTYVWYYDIWLTI